MSVTYGGQQIGVCVDVPGAITISTGSATDTTVAPIAGRITGFAYHLTTATTTAASVITVANATDSVSSTGSIPVAAQYATGFVSLASEVKVDAGDKITLTSDGGSDAGVAELWVFIAAGK